MSVVGLMFREALRWKKVRHKSSEEPYAQQFKQLHYQLKCAEHTKFGKEYKFTELLRTTSSLEKGTRITSKELLRIQQAFAARVPTFTYEQMYEEWWKNAYEGRKDVCWPGRITNFALSSGTSQSDSKRIPVTEEMLQHMRSVGLRQLCALTMYKLPLTFYTRSMLFLSGNMSLQKRENYVEGDISAMMAQRVPPWLRYHYRPSTHSTAQNWEEKLDKIVKKAAEWQVAGLSGSPTWVQLLLSRIIEHYKLASIHDIWPDLQLFVHGGVSFKPYREAFSSILTRPISYVETYLASEGFIAYQAAPGRAMRLALDAGIFYEFAPFRSTEENSLPKATETCSLSEVKLNEPYQLIISNLSGLWRYTIGDVIVFRSTHPFEVSIVGRTQHYLNLCGEHLCLDNLQTALAEVSTSLKLLTKEFTVFGKKKGHQFVHIWHIGVESDTIASPLEIAKELDNALQARNADYRMQRCTMLAEPQIKLLPSHYFYDWLKGEGKFGGQHKFPRVLRGKRLQSWLSQLPKERHSLRRDLSLQVEE